jgi:ribosome biogenesis GTPase
VVHSCLYVASGQGVDALRAYALAGRTLALIGSSGVGKSTLVNWFLGAARAASGAVRVDDDKGRHTTSARELFVCPNGGLLIDTPGMRELGLWDAHAGLESTFDDILVLAARCRFADCAHGTEPGCAVRSALDDGSLEPARYAAYGKLQRELAYEARNRDESARLEHQRRLRRVFRQRARAQRNRSPR